ncbi:MAG TPA: ATP-binding protein, partial [Vicinamibacterales bacterium]|nr:ATP-binding protein [Vicinamibacterales bacterium]
AFRLEMAVGAETVSTDRGVLRRLVYHLLSNAFRYTERGEVTVAVRPGDGDTIELVVRDTGTGIPPERARALSEPADTAATPAPDRGLGMGLSLVRRCVRVLGGTVTVRSEPDRGSEFTVRLPRVLDPRAMTAPSGTVH